MDKPHVPKSTNGTSKIDPSFKSKRYRDKLRTEIKSLEHLIPVDRSALHRKLDSQTVFRLVISFLRIKLLFKAFEILEKPAVLTSNVSSADFETQERATPEKNDCRRAEQFFKGPNIFQILDGFVLVASTDGTILYASDNVLQYLGFNQVDLMHRCIYGIVHPDDHSNTKTVIEKPVIQKISDDPSGESYASVPQFISFVCRMKCFNRTSAGYLKIHCSGKIESKPEILTRQNKSFPNVMLLYCQPFMLTGNDLTNDVKQNVFWSKHDMDLTVRELDKKAEEIVGYGTDELNDLTLYKYVHPEDLVTLAACHKTLTESTEVQTMYFRMETRNGRWVWLHSRGKVICKNSKKFSIVFTHCPVRIEDSTFLQQETALRNRYAISDLQYFLHNGHYSSGNSRFDSDNEDIHGMQKVSSFCTPHMGFTEDVSLSFYSPMITCPSSWHVMTDRHSPVLPSTHVAHKITQREKQLQFQEFKRRQQSDKHILKDDYGVSEAHSQLVAPEVEPFLPCNQYNVPYVKIEPQEAVYNNSNEVNCFMHAPNAMPSPNDIFHQQWMTSSPPKYHSMTSNISPPKHHAMTHGTFSPRYQTPNTTISPPKYHSMIPNTSHSRYDAVPPNTSPPKYHSMVPNTSPSRYDAVAPNTSPSAYHTVTPNTFVCNFPCSSHSYSTKHESSPFSNEQMYYYNNQLNGISYVTQPFPGFPNHCEKKTIDKNLCSNIQCPSNGHCNNFKYYSNNYKNNDRGVRVSVRCSAPAHPSHLSRHDNNFGMFPNSSNHFAFTTLPGQSCAMAHGMCKDDQVEYDIEASIHMKIVENPRNRRGCKSDIDLPSIGSFLEYLNDS